VRSFAAVPSVVGAGLGEVDFLPGALADVVDEEARAHGAGVEAMRKGFRKPPRERLLADRPRSGAAGDVAARGAGALEGVRQRDAAVRRDAQDLSDQDVAIARRVVGARAAGVAEIIASAVPHARVEVAVAAEIQVAPRCGCRRWSGSGR